MLASVLMGVVKERGMVGGLLQGASPSITERMLPTEGVLKSSLVEGA